MALPRIAPPALLTGLLVHLLAACGGGGGGTPGGTPIGACSGGGGGTVVTVTGNVTYRRLVLGPTGLGPATALRPARFVDLEVRGAGGGTCYGRTSTDASGDYAIQVAPAAGTDLEVVVFSRTLEDTDHDIVVHEADPPSFNAHDETNAFFFASASFTAASTTVDLTVPYDTGPANRPSIGFGLLDTLVTCWDEVTAALGRSLPTCHAYTRLGNNAALFNTSFYSHSARAIAILGGSAGSPDNSDTDYFDDAVVAHEFMHFVDKVIGHSMSRGGPHGGELLEPNFSWSEGLATGYGCLCLRDPLYIDTTGTGLFSSVQFSMSVENATQFDNDTIADEFTVAEIVWDLGDGGAGPDDDDSDGLTATYAELFAVLDGFMPATDAPYVGLFLERIVAESPAISSAAMGSFLAGPPEDQQISWPLMGDDVWPTTIMVGDTVVGEVDATTAPAGSVCRTYDSSRWFQLTLASNQTVTFDLTMTPLGGTPGDLDLHLTPNSDVNFPLASSTNGGSTAESISISLSAGTYIVRVESCGQNRASFSLDIQ